MDEGNSDNSIVKSASSTTVRNSLVTKYDITKSSKKNSSGKRRKHSRHSSDNDDRDSSPSRKIKKKLKKLKKKSKKSKKEKKYKSDCPPSLEDDSVDAGEFGPAVPEEIVARAKMMAPMTKDEWDRRQSNIKRVYDEESGRYRLVRGDGEIIEECVSRDRHRQINKQATAADGLYFQAQLKK